MSWTACQVRLNDGLILRCCKLVHPADYQPYL